MGTHFFSVTIVLGNVSPLSYFTLVTAPALIYCQPSGPQRHAWGNFFCPHGVSLVFGKHMALLASTRAVFDGQSWQEYK